MRGLLLVPALALGLTFLAACGKDIQNQDAVRQGVMTYLAKRSDLMAMDVDISAVSFKKNEANATVHFQAKGVNNSAAGMTINYVLERKGNLWVVKGRSGGLAGNPHGGQAAPDGAMGGAPQGDSPQAGSPQADSPQGRSLPAGHPAIGADSMPPGASAPALPPGHPSLNGSGPAPQGGSSTPALPPGHPAIHPGQNPPKP